MARGLARRLTGTDSVPQDGRSRSRVFSFSRPKVYALRSDGSRRGEVESVFKAGALRFTADTARDPSDATFLYEIVR